MHDDTKHWKECTYSDCSYISEEADHAGTEATCFTLSVCDTCDESFGEYAPHEYEEELTCQDRQCLNCSHIEPKSTEHSYSGGKCEYCGEESIYFKDGNYIYFGEYPQTIKAEDVEITETQDSRGYYLGSDGEYYAKVIAAPYSSKDAFSTGASVTAGNAYYFKVEPIRWRILRESNGEAFILCDGIIANHRYDDNSNNYANSEIRAWLNKEFYNAAFNAVQKEVILTTTVNNSAASTGFSSNPCACGNTYDNIFLPSYSEVTNSAYGFASSGSTANPARSMKTTDYSKATGVYMGNSYGWWYLRSPFNKRYYNGVRAVECSGYVSDSGYYFYITGTAGGVVPALRIKL